MIYCFLDRISHPSLTSPLRDLMHKLKIAPMHGMEGIKLQLFRRFTMRF